MESEIRVPPLGESIVEATVGRWLKSPGEAVAAGEPVVELETEKVNLEVTADSSGVLQRILHQAGEVVHVGDVLGVVASAAEQPSPTAPAAPPQAAAAPSEVLASPVARQIAAEYGVPLTEVRGTGPGGRITREDVMAYLQQHPTGPAAPPAGPAVAPTAPPPPPPAGPAAPPIETAPLPTEQPPAARVERREERIRLSRRRLTIARRLLEAQHTQALLTTFNEIDMSAVMELRRRRREAFLAKYGVSLGLMSFFVKASIGALKAFPHVNSEMQGDELIVKHYYDIGIAVDTEAGLVVPVIRDADRKSFAEIEREIADLAKRARENQLGLEELRGGTFTITNGGVFGSLLSTPIVNPPQAAILGMHRIIERPVAIQGQVVIRPMMYVALTYDHRIIDGRVAVQFLVRVKELIEDPELLLLEA
ncbi:MAG: 2-oxoglutarate dehydrogenase complex dihydrolipoyllysine-residue succinyltransferase [Chloroflexi bacterium]|nr:2-oxoglutarate dehydrogenase complex dihydrolipoyllysine-residue succinyltransferase [Chloroflexota bacterium]